MSSQPQASSSGAWVIRIVILLSIILLVGNILINSGLSIGPEGGIGDRVKADSEKGAAGEPTGHQTGLPTGNQGGLPTGNQTGLPTETTATCEDFPTADVVKPANPEFCGGALWAELPGWGVRDLDEDLRPSRCNGGISPSHARAKEHMGIAVFAFGVTYVKNHDMAVASHQSWAQQFPGFVWFSTEPDERLKGKMIVLNHCKPPIYNHMTYRMLDIWAHVWRYWHGYDQYLRLWDDNWVDHVTLRQMIASNNLLGAEATAAKRVWGRLGTFGGHEFAGGGAGSLLSHGGAAAWLGSPDTLDGLLACNDWFLKNGAGQPALEDVWLSRCMANVGVEFKRHDGFKSHSISKKIPIDSWSKLTDQDIACRRPFKEASDHQATPFVTMHYVNAADIVKLSQLVNDGCTSE